MKILKTSFATYTSCDFISRFVQKEANKITFKKDISVTTKDGGMDISMDNIYEAQDYKFKALVSKIEIIGGEVITEINDEVFKKIPQEDVEAVLDQYENKKDQEVFPKK